VARRIFFTGGGTAGHVTPNIALIEHLQKGDWDIAYVGSSAGIEQTLVSQLEIPFYSISTGKLRRYFDWNNFLDPLKIIWGTLQSIFLCLKYRPNIVFSKGGFVAVPLVVGAWLCRVPVICHESDLTPGLANKLCFPFCRYVCVNFEQTRQFIPKKSRHKVKVTGSPVRESLLSGNAVAGRSFLGFTDSKPVLLIFGGSLGARVINDCIRESIPELVKNYQVIHVVGEGNVVTGEDNGNQPHQQKEYQQKEYQQKEYQQKEYLHQEFGDVLTAAHVVISRAGANSIYELLLTRTPHILVPLSLRSSRGDQIKNASLFEAEGMSLVIQEEALNPDNLLSTLGRLEKTRDTQVTALRRFHVKDSVALITDLLDQTAR